MTSIRSYLLSVTGAALLCGLANRFLGKKGAAVAARFLSGIFLVLAVLQPLGKEYSGFINDLRLDISNAAEDAIVEGKDSSKKAMGQIIKEKTAAYILEKARELHANIQVTVEVSNDQLPTPIGVRITGSVAPYAKIQLQEFISRQLGISKENQRWT